MNRKKIKKPYPDEQKISEITLIGAITDNYTYQNQFHQYEPVDLFPNDIGFFFFLHFKLLYYSSCFIRITWFMAQNHKNQKKCNPVVGIAKKKKKNKKG